MEHSLPQYEEPSRLPSEQFHPSRDWNHQESMHRERYAPSHQHHQGEGLILHSRYPLYNVDHAHYHDGYNQHRQQRLMQVDEALRLHCGIPAKKCFVAAIMEDGSVVTSSSPGQLHETNIRRFFLRDEFCHAMGGADAGNDTNLELNGPLGLGEQRDKLFVGDGRKIMHRCQSTSAFQAWDAAAIQSSERARGRDEGASMNTTVRKPVMIGDSDAVRQYYEEQFRVCQQSACKLIAKAWIKTIEPKKQSAHPYTGKEVPEWWPTPSGSSTEGVVRHKEPDHLYKTERIHLLVHIMRTVMEPEERQLSSIRKLDLRIKNLREVTFETLSGFFTESDANAKRKLILEEMFRVASQEERYKNSEIDATTTMLVNTKKVQARTTHIGARAFRIEEDKYGPPVMSATAKYTPVHMPESAPMSVNRLTSSYMSHLPARPSPTPTTITEMAGQPHFIMPSEDIPAHGLAPVNFISEGIGKDMIASSQHTSKRPSVFSNYVGTSGSPLNLEHWQMRLFGPRMSYTCMPPQPEMQHLPLAGQNAQVNPGTVLCDQQFEMVPPHNHLHKVGSPLPWAIENHMSHGYECISKDGRMYHEQLGRSA